MRYHCNNKLSNKYLFLLKLSTLIQKRILVRMEHYIQEIFLNFILASIKYLQTKKVIVYNT